MESPDSPPAAHRNEKISRSDKFQVRYRQRTFCPECPEVPKWALIDEITAPHSTVYWFYSFRSCIQEMDRRIRAYSIQR